MNGAISYFDGGYSDFWILPAGLLLIGLGCFLIGILLSRDDRKTHARALRKPQDESDGANPQLRTPQINRHGIRRKGKIG